MRFTKGIPLVQIFKLILNTNSYIHSLTCLFLFVLGIESTIAQHKNNIIASLDGETKTVSIQQEFTYKNTSDSTLTTLYFNDWAHAYSDKNTALAIRFADQFKKSLHLAKKSERGTTKIMSAVDDEYRGMHWKRTKGKDIIKLTLNDSLLPNETVELFITYDVKLPPKKFTSYGYKNKNNYYLKDWYLTPAVFNNEWQLYSNKNLEDIYTGVTETSINFSCPDSLFLATNYRVLDTIKANNKQQFQLEGTKQKSCRILLNPKNKFTTHITTNMTVLSDLGLAKYDGISQSISINKITKFIHKNLGEFPHQQLLISEIDYTKYPLFDINQLPSFIRPYEKQFQFEMKFLKTALINILEETIYINPRKEQWVNDAIANYLMIAYVDEFYPNQKLLGKLSKIWGIRSFNMAKMDFNQQYSFVHLLMARKNKDQPLKTSNDSLLWFNQKVANKYKAGLGLAYLSSYIGKEKVDQGIKKFYKNFHLKKVNVVDFETTLKEESDTNIDWFFNDYVSTDKRIDFKIKKIDKGKDSLRVTLKNKSGTNVPISLSGITKNGEITSKYWFSNIVEEKIVTIPNNKEKRLVLNYDRTIPEFNERDNWKSLGGFFSGNKKLKFTFFRDTENPYYNQLFYVPVVNFNVYDGWTPGLRLYNKTFLERPFVFDFSPSYSFRERTFTGFGKFTYRQYLKKTGLYVLNYGLRGSTSHFNVNSRVISFTPTFSLGWRPKDDITSNKTQSLLFRYINIYRTFDESLTDLSNNPESPDYNVLNARFSSLDNNILNFKFWRADFQHSSEFTKVSFEYIYRKLFENNRQLNLRFYAGKFLKNNTKNPFFNFALDRPTDYLFDYSYLARSNDTGIYSQQFIIAEGAFKSVLDEEYRFSNDWIATANASTNLWKWIELYGDVGFVKNKEAQGKFVYDSGVRLNLVTDYFELFFPVYSNNGWEIAQPNYDEKIRFVITVDIKTLTGLFTRKWF